MENIKDLKNALENDVSYIELEGDLAEEIMNLFSYLEKSSLSDWSIIIGAGGAIAGAIVGRTGFPGKIGNALGTISKHGKIDKLGTKEIDKLKGYKLSKVSGGKVILEKKSNKLMKGNRL